MIAIPLASFPGPAMGPGWAPYRRSMSSTFVANIGIVAVIVGLFLAIRDLWASDGGEQVWSWLHTLAEDRDRFVSTGGTVIAVAGIIALTVMSVRLGGAALPNSGLMKRSVNYEHLDTVEAVARYHAAQTVVLHAFGAQVRQISLSSTIISSTLRAGGTFAQWRALVQEPATDTEKNWATLVATIAASHHFHGTLGNPEIAEWNDDELSQLHQMALRLLLSDDRPADYTGQWSVDGILAAAKRQAVDLLADHRVEVAALAQAAAANFCHVIPKPLYAEEIRTCLSDPVTVLSDTRYAIPHDPSGIATGFAAAMVSILGSAAAIVGISLDVFGLIAAGLGAVVVGGLVLMVRVDGRDLNRRIDFELQRAHHRRIQRHNAMQDRAAAGTDDGHRDGQTIGESIESDGHLRGE